MNVRWLSRLFSVQPNARIQSVANGGDQLGSGVSVNSKSTEKTVTVGVCIGCHFHSVDTPSLVGISGNGLCLRVPTGIGLGEFVPYSACFEQRRLRYGGLPWR